MRQAGSTALVVAAGLACLLGGCARDSVPTARGSRSLSPSDFVAAGGAPTAAVVVTQAPVQPAPGGALDVNLTAGREATGRRPAEISGPIGESRGLTDVQGRVGSPEPGTAGTPVGGPVLVDAKIGEVNGKPIFASTFFDVGSPTQEPLGRRLAARAKEAGRQAWMEFAAREIVNRLDEIIRPELLRAEALSNLPVEKQQGLFAWVENLQEEARRQSGGSQEAFKRKLAEEDLTPEQMLRMRQESALIYLELQQKVERRLNVTARDISQAYNGRFYDRYHHPPRYQFRLIMTPKDATEDVARVEQALAGGTPFEDVATLKANRYKRDDDPAKAGLELREVADPKAMGEIFASPVLNNAAAGLGAGATSPRLDVGTSWAWLHLSGIIDPPDEYAAQLPIEDELLRERRRVAEARYLERLAGRASVTSIPQMREQLLKIAMERYLPAAAR
ncbi:MAG: hypothetical protein WAZ94_14940 [Phycisphaerales bacterium]